MYSFHITVNWSSDNSSSVGLSCTGISHICISLFLFFTSNVTRSGSRRELGGTWSFICSMLIHNKNLLFLDTALEIFPSFSVTYISLKKKKQRNWKPRIEIFLLVEVILAVNKSCNLKGHRSWLDADLTRAAVL